MRQALAPRMRARRGQRPAVVAKCAPKPSQRAVLVYVRASRTVRAYVAMLT